MLWQDDDDDDDESEEESETFANIDCLVECDMDYEFCISDLVDRCTTNLFDCEEMCLEESEDLDTCNDGCIEEHEMCIDEATDCNDDFEACEGACA